jgi:site-specific DNA recombinase
MEARNSFPDTASKWRIVTSVISLKLQAQQLQEAFMTPETGTRVVLYLRVSTQEQASSGVSLGMQESRLRAYAEAHGLQIIETVTDAGFSGKSLDRPGMKRVLQLIESREVGGVVIWKLDRLTRSVRDLANLLPDLEAAQVALHSLSDNIDTSTPSGRLVIHMTASVAEWERETIAERVRHALAQAKANGTHLGQPPVGYRVEGGKLVPTDRYRLVELAHAWRSEGLTLRAMAARFAKREDLCELAGRTRWYPAQVARLLKAPVTV